MNGVGVFDCVQYDALMAWGDKALRQAAARST